MTEKDHLKGRSWIIDLHTLQRKVLLMFKVLMSPSAEVLFVAKVITRTNKKHHSPPEEAVAAEGSDYIKSEIFLQLFVKVWEQNKCHPRAALILRHGYRIVLK